MNQVQLLRELEKDITPQTADHLLAFITETNEAKFLTQVDKLEIIDRIDKSRVDINNNMWKLLAAVCTFTSIALVIFGLVTKK